MDLERRLKLHAILVAIPDVKKVYFQPPPNIVLEYPCIVYNRDNINTEFADNLPYSQTKRYSVTVIDRDPDSEIHLKVAELPRSSYSRFFTKDGLNHDNITLYF